MNSKEITRSIVISVAILIGIALITLLLFEIKSVFLYIIMASVLTLVGKPIVFFLNTRLKLNRTLAALFTIFLFLAVIFVFFSLFMPLFVNQGRSLSFLNYDYLKTNTSVLINEGSVFLKKQGIELEQNYSPKEIISKINFNYIPSLFNSVVNLFANLAIGIFSTLFITFYLLKENNVIGRILLVIFNKKHHEGISKSTVEIKALLSRYFIGLFLQILILFVIYSLTLIVFDIPNALLIGLLCALLNLIPYVGPLIGVLLMVLLAAIGIISEDFNLVIIPTCMYLIAIYGIAQLFDNFICQPIIFSKSTKSHPLEIFIVILISGMIFGILGMMVAIPTYTASKVVAKEFFPSNRFIKFLTKNF